MSQKIIPRGKRILVLRDEAESLVSEHGITAAANVEREQRAYGTVVAVGAEVKDLKEGDRVIYGAYAGETIEEKIKGKAVEYKLLDDEDVIAFLK